MLLIFFIPLLSDKIEFIQTYYQTYYIDYTNTPPGDGSWVDPWPNFNYINTSLSEGDIINVRAGTYVFSTTYTISDSGTVSGGGEIRFIGDKDGTVFNTNPDDVVIQCSLNAPAIEITGDFVTFENFKFVYTGNNYAVYIHNNENTEIKNCDFECDNGAIYTSVTASSRIFDNNFYRTDDTTGNIVLIANSQYIQFHDNFFTATSTNYCGTNLNITNCNNSWIYRNRINCKGDYGIFVHSGSYDMHLYNNAIYGDFNDYAVNDTADNLAGFNWNHNTLYNIGSGGGYFGQRNSGYHLDSFRNNICVVDNSNNYAIEIDNNPSDWKPDYGYFTCNGYYNFNGVFGYWYPTSYSSDSYWYTATGDFCKVADPDFYDYIHLKSSSPSEFRFDGSDVYGIIDDIDKGARPDDSIGISRGADQFNIATFEPEPINFPTTVVNNTSYENLTITNYGLSNFAISYVTISGTNLNDFSHNWTTTVYPNPGVGYVIVVSFTPLSSGPKTATLNITHNAVEPGASPTIKQITLSGYGTN